MLSNSQDLHLSNSGMVKTIYDKIRDQLSLHVLGQEEALDLLVTALLAGGHVLVEGVPGLAKTFMVKTLAQLVGGQTGRIQFTPDLMPSDVTGTMVFDARSGAFHFRQGPIFANMILADEVNRTPPKTQAALLEAMEEGHITVEGKAQPLPEPFMVCATQNPVEQEGTYPLPEAQLDRFLFKITLTYPGADQEQAVLISTLNRIGVTSRYVEATKPVVTPADIVMCQQAVATVTVADDITRYVIQVIRRTREHPRVYLGASPRGALMLTRAAQTYAAAMGRGFVIPDDIKQMALPVLRHRLLLYPEADIEGITTDNVIGEILQTTEVLR